MHKRKRILSAIMALIMVFSIFSASSVTAFAYYQDRDTRDDAPTWVQQMGDGGTISWTYRMPFLLNYEFLSAMMPLHGVSGDHLFYSYSASNHSNDLGIVDGRSIVNGYIETTVELEDGGVGYGVWHEPRENLTYLALTYAMEAGPEGLHSIPLNQIFTNNYFAAQAVSALMIGIWKGLYVVDETTGYLMWSGRNYPMFPGWYTEYGGHRWDTSSTLWYKNGSSAYVPDQHNINQDLITLMAYVDSAMHYEVTGEVLTDTRTGTTMKELIASDYPEDNLVVPEIQEVPNNVTSAVVQSGAGATFHASGGNSYLEPVVWFTPSVEWGPMGKIEIYKAAEDASAGYNTGSLSGIQFTATHTDGTVKTATTNASGYCLFDGLKFGTWTITESTPNKYKANSTHPLSRSVTLSSDVSEVSINVSNNLVTGGISLDKYDVNFNTETVPEGDATFNKTQFWVQNISGETIKYTDANGVRWVNNGDFVTNSNNNNRAIFETDTSGHLETNDNAFSYGVYRIYEKSTDDSFGTGHPIGYDTNTSWYTDVSIVTDKVIVPVAYNSRILESPSLSGDITVQKFDKDMYDVPYNRGDEVSNAKPQGDATLAGAKIEVYNKSQRKIWYNGRAVAPNGLVDTITTNAQGVALITGLVYGTYLFKEVAPPTGYLLNGEWSQTLVQHGATGTRFHIGTNGATKAQSVRDDVIRGQVVIEKYDYETLGKLSLGATSTGQSLAGAQIQVTNRSAQPIYYHGPNGANKWVPVNGIVDVYTTDDSGHAESPAGALPYGTYEFTEIKAPTGYNVNTSWVQTVQVRENGKTYSLSGSGTGLYDKVMRGDLKFNKTDAATQEVLANVAFRITSLTTGESHIVVTDPNGVFDSTIFPNQQVTGYGGGQNQAGPQADAYNLSLINSNDNAVYSDGSVNVAALNPYAGVWFTGSADIQTQPKEGLRPFPYGTYEVEELRCESNADKVLVKFTITVNAQSQVIDRGSVDDVFPEIRTMLLDQDTQDHVAAPKAEVVLIDYITYTDLYPGKTYYLKGILIDRATGNPVQIDGSPIVGIQEFVADGTEGTVNLRFLMNAQMLANKTLVAYVDLYDEASMTESRYESHDINNEDETVRFPSISTTLTGEHGEKEVISSTSCVMIDTVQFTNLLPNQTYVMHAELRDKSNGQILLDGSGAQLIREVTFVPTTENGTVEVPFMFDSRLVEGKTIVCFESLRRNTAVIASHEDLDDAEQTVTMPSISTTLWDEDGNHVVYDAETIKLVDTVEFHALQIGKQYIMRGTLIDKLTGQPLQRPDGSDITAEQSFTPQANDGTVDVIFEFPGEIAEGKTLVAFETCVAANLPDFQIAEHQDIDDEDQTVYIPKIRTTLTDMNEEKELYADGKPKAVVDTVDYEGLKVGESYTMHGQLINKATDEVLAEAETTFFCRSDYGTVRLEFVLDTELLQGQSVVAFEELTLDARLVADHKDKDDDDQVVTLPKIRTTAHTPDDDKEMLATEGLTIIDTVHYENLVPGHIYTLSAWVVDAEDGKPPKDDKGESFTGVLTFTAPQSTGDIDVNIPIDTTNLEGKTIVIFEELYDVNDRIIGSHKDLTDTDQTMTIPKIRTTLVSEIDKDLAFATENVTLTDAVVFENLTPYKQYTMTGTLMDKATGQPFKTESVTFTPETPDGSVDVVFNFDATDLQAVTLVAFEELRNNLDLVVALHEDIEDEDQSIRFPKIRTSAANVNGKKELFATEKIIVNDIVTYENLLPGNTYTMKGYLVDKSNPDTVLAEGETKFKPATEEGSVIVKFVFNTKELEGMTLVAFEEVLLNGEIVAQHKDLTDKEQTLNIPKIRTNAHDDIDDTSKEFLAEDKVELIDTVLYWNLTPGEKYTVEGVLHNQETGKLIRDSEGNPIEASTTFTPEAPDGSVDVIFTFDGSVLENVTIQIEETVYNFDEEIVGHEYLDQNEIVWIPKIRTQLVDGYGEHVTFCGEDGEKIILTDTISYWNLRPGELYVVEGVLMNPETGEVGLDSDGNEIRASGEFTPETEDGFVELDFEFDASAIDGITLVAFEYVSVQSTGKLIGEHEDLEDEEQTIHIPHIQSYAANAAGEKEFNAKGIMTLNDNLEYDHVLAGEKYVIVGVVVDKATGDPVVDAKGNEIRSIKTFTAILEENEDGLYCPCLGQMKNSFKFDASNMEGKTLVVYEYVYHNGILVAKHEDIDDPEQTVTFPKIRTTLHGEQDVREKEFLAEGTLKLVDTVDYWNLVPETIYTLSGTLMDKTTKQELKDIYGYPVTATTTFTPDTVNGSVDVVFEFDVSHMKNKTTVAYETLANEYSVVAEHKDLNDEAQTVTFPEIRTTLVADDGTHVALAQENLHLIDTVSFKNLIPGNTYTLTGTLMDQMTGEPVENADGTPVQSSDTFVAPSKDGTWDIEFTFDASELAGHTMVAFEQLSYEFGVIAKHEEIEDEAQTVWIPEIHTNASDEDGNKDFFADGKITVIDVVSYKNLPIGRYRLYGRLMDKATGEVLVDHKGKEVISEMTFRVDDMEGEVTLKFTFDATDLAGHTLVAFEQLYLGESLVAIHEDLEDEDQTVRFPDIHTEATDQFYQHATNTGLQTKIIDRVDYTNLIPGETYVMIGKLVNKADGKVLKDYAGDEVIAETMFDPQEESGSIEVEFIVDTTELLNGGLVAFETLTHDGRVVAVHEDVTDEQQSVYFPTIRTHASIGETNIATVTPDTEFIIVTDVVEFNDVVANETYTMSGTLMDKETGAVIKDAEGNAIVGTATFTPTTTSGSMEMTFKVPITSLLGEQHNITKIVVFERLILGQNTIAKHEDYSDENQTVYVPVVTKIRKLDASSYAPVANAVFKIEDRGIIGSAEAVQLVPTQQVISDNEGYVYFDVMPNHEYAITEIAAPNGYYIDTTEHIVDADGLGNIKGDIVLYNVKGGTVIITKTNAVTGEAMQGCEVTIYRRFVDEEATEQNLQKAMEKTRKQRTELKAGVDYEIAYRWVKEFTQTTDRKGRVYYYTEDPGTFKFKETKTVDGFYLNKDESEFVVDENLKVTGDLALRNVPFGTVVVQKLDPEGRPLSGAKLAFWDQYDRKLGEAVTDTKGRVYFVSPGPEKYYYTELEPPQGFALTKNRYHFTVNGDYTIVGQLEFVNSRTPDYPSDSSRSTTGDNENLALWAALMGMTAMLAAGTFVFTKKRKKEDGK